ncbi:MAG: hypothetical protein Q4B26_02265 [Eubacteriales bacterium]|nr:hypothetical protein [Eubacteriales bacterium]
MAEYTKERAVTGEKRPTVNEVTLRGRVVEMGFNNMGLPRLRILVRSNTPAKPAAFDVVCTKASGDVRPHAYVMVKGFIRSIPRKRVEEGDRRTYIQYVEATEIKRVKTELEERFGVPGRYTSANFFICHIEGYVVEAVRTGKEWGNLVVRTDGVGTDKRPCYIRLNYHITRYLPDFDYVRGQRVCIYASMHSTERVVNGYERRFENLVVEDIARIDENGKLYDGKSDLYSEEALGTQEEQDTAEDFMKDVMRSIRTPKMPVDEGVESDDDYYDNNEEEGGLIF